jgi:regulatory protein
MNKTKEIIILDKSMAQAKAEHFCAYQERSQQEARDKLYSFGLHSADVENIISNLIQSNFLNEERFSIAYTLGKFRIKHWGKQKIKQGLKFKQVPEKLIRKALNQIDGDEYVRVLIKLLQKKAATSNEFNKAKLNYSLSQYAVAKGYERDIVIECLNNLA